jgi:hypothetical protein
MTFALVLVADAVRKFRRLILLKGAPLLHFRLRVRRPALHRPVVTRAHPGAQIRRLDARAHRVRPVEGPLRALRRPEVDTARDNCSDSKAILKFGGAKTVETDFHRQSGVGS